MSSLAKLFKERENISYLGPQIGEIIMPPNDIKIALGDKIVLEKENLIFSSYILNSYSRQFEIKSDENNITFEQDNPGEAFNKEVSGATPPIHLHKISKMNISTNYESTGTITFTDTLKKGDLVLLIPTTDEQKYYVIDKVVKE
ncbi:DUF2577 family protein [Clostridiaceae bacterium M8S5]|nr:DUF2577 family protein [Clostridiaceae bacterium M8S5]